MRNTGMEPAQGTPTAEPPAGVKFALTGTGEETAGFAVENERLKAELLQQQELYIRNLAEFDNYRRRVERERIQAVRASKRELLLPLLEVVEDFDRALQLAGDEPQLVAAGLHAIYCRLSGLLATQGVTAFESRGESFNPRLHEAIGTVERALAAPGTLPGTVVDELSRGWRWGAELLRPAQVRVAK